MNKTSFAAARRGRHVLSRRSLFRKGILALGGATIVPSGKAVSQPWSTVADAEKQGQVPLRIIVVESQAEADQILKLLKSGEDFGSIAVGQSIDPTANQAGYLGLFDPALLRPELRDALKGIKPGEFSSAVRIPEG
jgi:parvulin-like peptidyl-prolyl isomerase